MSILFILHITLYGKKGGDEGTERKEVMRERKEVKWPRLVGGEHPLKPAGVRADGQCQGVRIGGQGLRGSEHPLKSAGVRAPTETSAGGRKGGRAIKQ